MTIYSGNCLYWNFQTGTFNWGAVVVQDDDANLSAGTSPEGFVPRGSLTVEGTTRPLNLALFGTSNIQFETLSGNIYLHIGSAIQVSASEIIIFPHSTGTYFGFRMTQIAGFFPPAPITLGAPLVTYGQVALRVRTENDLYDLTPGNDTLNSGAGNDTVLAGGGDDSILGGAGDDDLRGHAGDDILDGGEGNDTLTGSDGADSLRGGDGADLLLGGSGNDTLLGGHGPDTLRGGDGADLIQGDGGSAGSSDLGNVLIGAQGDDTVLGGSGADTITGGMGNDSLNGGFGADILWGGIGADTVSGADGNDTLWGDGNDDVLFGGGNADLLIGGPGNDLLYGGTHDDTLRGGIGQDTLWGDHGYDRFEFRKGENTVVIADFSTTYDSLFLDARLWGGAVLSGAQILALFGDDSGPDLVLTFGAEVLILSNQNATSAIAADIHIL